MLKESSIVESGNEVPEVFDSPIGKLGLSIVITLILIKLSATI